VWLPGKANSAKARRGVVRAGDTAREVEEGVTIKEEREEDAITDSGVESEERFDLDSESDFDDDIDGDEDMDDENM